MDFTRAPRPARIITAVLSGLILLGAVAGLSGCRTRFPGEQVPKMKWLIMPFDQPPVMGTTPPIVRGWWFGARTIRENPRAGAAFADILNRKMLRLEFLSLFSAIDLKYYFADKRKLLQDAWPNLTDPQLDEALRNVPATEYAKELGADKVLTGRILRQQMGENRTIHWWWAVFDVEIQIIDAGTGRVEWTRRYDVRKQFAFMSTLQEKVADRLINDLEKTYFQPMIKK